MGLRIWLLWTIVSVAILLLVPQLVLAGNPPKDQCGWPYMSQSGGRFGPWSVRQAQYFLAGTLRLSNVTVDGNYTAATTALVKLFQQHVGITATGVLDHQTWSVLAGNVAATAKYGASGMQISGIQDALTFQGFDTKITGTFDEQTRAALQRFQLARGASSPANGMQATPQTMHLLVTGCNTSGAFWIDVGWPQGSMSLDMLTCMVNNGSFKFATFECWVEKGPQGQFWPECVDNVAHAWSAGFQSVGVYMYAQRYFDPAIQAQQLINNLTLHRVKYDSIMLDIEGDKWNQYTQAQNREFISTLRTSLERLGVKRLVVYCGDEWPLFFGAEFTAFADLPIVYAHYDNIPSYYDWYPNYGGWTQPSGKQFWDGAQGESICGTGAVDWDWSARPFWL